MRVLELFSGTHSVGKICKELGWEVVSLDLQNADINVDIRKWKYTKAYPKGHFDIIWASPPCVSFSMLRYCNIGRKIKTLGGQVATRELLDKDMYDNGIPILRKTERIIRYYKPKYYFLENPQSGRMKHFIKFKDYYDVDYCKYGFPYRKRTRIWTNKKNFNNKLCKYDCGKTTISEKGNKKHINYADKYTTKILYRIPPELIKELFENLE